MCDCNCCTKDELQGCACILFKCEAGCWPCGCTPSPSFCWGCTCFSYRMDGCFFPRQLLEGSCYCIPGGKTCVGHVEWLCCCPPNIDPKAATPTTAGETQPLAATPRA